MTRSELIADVERIKALSEDVLRRLRGQQTDKSRKPRRTTDPRGASAKTLPEWILGLRDQRFFAQPKTTSEAHTRLTGHYPCNLNRVAVALIRLQKARQLRKTFKVVKGKKQIAYVW